jgi:hypothetical protein
MEFGLIFTGFSEGAMEAINPKNNKNKIMFNSKIPTIVANTYLKKLFI